MVGAETTGVIVMKAGKRLLVSLLGAALALMLVSGVALAGTETAARTRSTLAQGDPYYWVKCEQERLGLCVFAGTDAEAGFRLQIAQDRLDEAAQLMEQSRFAEANSALEQYRVQMQAMNQAMVTLRERAATEAAAGSGAGNGSTENKLATRTGWLNPGEIISRVEQQTRTQLQTLSQLCTQAQDQVRDQARLALEECTRACVQDRSGQATSGGNQGSASGQANQAQGTSVNAGQQTQTREQVQTQEQNQTREQNQGQEQQQNQEQNQTQEQQQQQNGPATPPQQQSPQNQPPTPGPTEQPNHGK